MNPSRHVWRVVALWAILVGQVVSGADDDDDPPVGNAQKNHVVVEDSIFDRWVFQDNQPVEGRNRNGDAATGRARINLQLKAMLDDLVQVCQLNDSQQQKLALAARGDMTRFFDQVEEVRRKYLAVKDDQNRMNEVWPQISSLQQQFSRGLFGDKSLFAKILRKTLTDEQHAKYQAVLLDRRRTGFKAAIELSLHSFGNGVGLRGEQQEALQKLLLEETQPPLLFGQQDRNVVMLRLSQLPAAKLKGVLDKDQWKKLQPQVLQASGHEDTLIHHGVIEEPKANAPVIVRSVRTVVDGPLTAPTDAVKPD